MTEIDELELALSVVQVRPTFTRRPDPVPADLRLGWRVGAIALALDRRRGKTAYLEQLHLLVWALRSKETRDVLERWFSGNRHPNDIIVRFDPALSRTISLAMASGIAVKKGTQSVGLGDAGKRLADDIRRDPDIMAAEKEFLLSLPAAITQKSVRELTEWR